MTAAKKLPPADVLIPVSFAVVIPLSWFAYFDSGEFINAIGYWAWFVRRQRGAAPILFAGGDEAPTLEQHRAMGRAVRLREPLPEGWHRIDRDAVIRAYVEGIKLWGLGWYDDPKTDKWRRDRVIQRALLGSEVFG